MAGKKAGFLCITPKVRQGFKPLPQGKSPLKRTDDLFSPLERTFAISQGINSLADFRVKLPYIGTAMSRIFSNRKLLISSKSTNQKPQTNLTHTNQVICQHNLSN